MQVITQNSLLTFQQVTIEEAEIITEALVMYKSKLDAEEFRDARQSCVDMFMLIDEKLIKSRN